MCVGGGGGNSHALRTYLHSQLYQCSPLVTLQESPPCYSVYNAVSMVQQCLLHGDNHKGRRGEVPVVLSELTPAYTMHDLVMLRLVMIPLYSTGQPPPMTLSGLECCVCVAVAVGYKPLYINHQSLCHQIYPWPTFRGGYSLH